MRGVGFFFVALFVIATLRRQEKEEWVKQRERAPRQLLNNIILYYRASKQNETAL